MLDMALRFCEVLESGNRGGIRERRRKGRRRNAILVASSFVGDRDSSF